LILFGATKAPRHKEKLTTNEHEQTRILTADFTEILLDKDIVLSINQKDYEPFNKLWGEIVRLLMFCFCQGFRLCLKATAGQDGGQVTLIVQ